MSIPWNELRRVSNGRIQSHRSTMRIASPTHLRRPFIRALLSEWKTLHPAAWKQNHEREHRLIKWGVFVVLPSIFIAPIAVAYSAAILLDVPISAREHRILIRSVAAQSVFTAILWIMYLWKLRPDYMMQLREVEMKLAEQRARV